MSQPATTPCCNAVAVLGGTGRGWEAHSTLPVCEQWEGKGLSDDSLLETPSPLSPSIAIPSDPYSTPHRRSQHSPSLDRSTYTPLLCVYTATAAASSAGR